MSITLVQQIAGTQGYGNQISLTPTVQAWTIGNTIVVKARSKVITSVTCAAVSGGFTEEAQIAFSAFNASMWVGIVTANTSDPVLVNVSGNLNYVANAKEYTGGLAVDVTPVATSGINGGAASLSITPIGGKNSVIEWCGAVQAATSIPSSGGWTEDTDDSTFLPAEYQIAASTSGSYTASIAIGYNSYGMCMMNLVASGGTTVFTINLLSGTFVETGTSIGLKWIHKLGLGSGSFTETGTNIGLKWIHKLPIGSGTFTLTGTSVGLKRNRTLTPASGTFTETGTNVTLRWHHHLPVGSGSFVLTGTDITLTYIPVSPTKTITLGSGTFNLTGTAVTLRWNHKIGLGAGSVIWTGSPIGLAYRRRINLGNGSFVLTGFPVDLSSTAGSNGPYDNKFVDSEAEIEDPKALIPVGLSTTRRPGALTFDYQTAFTYDNGVAKYVRTSGNTVFVAQSNGGYTDWAAESVLFTFTGAQIDEIDCCIDASGQLVVVAERTGSIWLWNGTFTTLDTGRTPRIALVDGDVNVVYMQDGTGMLSRSQAESYATAHATPQLLTDGWYVEEFGLNRGGRAAVVLSNRSGVRYFLAHIETQLLPVTLDDRLGFAIVPDTSSSLRFIAAFYDPTPEAIGFTLVPLTSSVFGDPTALYTTQEQERLGFTLVPVNTSFFGSLTVSYNTEEIERVGFTLVPLDESALTGPVTYSTEETERLGFTLHVLNTSTLES